MWEEYDENDVDLSSWGDWGLDIEEGQDCHYCFGTGIDRELDSDCLVCFGDGVL